MTTACTRSLTPSLVEKSADVCLRGGLAYEHRCCDLAVAQTVSEMLEGFVLSVGEVLGKRGADRGMLGLGNELFDQSFGDCWGEQSIAGSDDPDRSDEFGGRSVFHEVSAGPCQVLDGGSEFCPYSGPNPTGLGSGCLCCARQTSVPRV